MEISQAGLQFIASRESLALVSYRPIPEDPNWTLGYGRISGITEGMTTTSEQALDWLRQDVQGPENVVNHYVTYQLEQFQADALISLIYNIGGSAFTHSSALKYLNQGDIDNFVNQAFSEENGFVKAGGKVIQGLVNRRSAESNLFLTGSYT